MPHCLAERTNANATLAFRQSDPPESNVPSVALTRSRDGTTGTATFRFDNASVLDIDNVWDNGLLTGLWLRDQEGTLHTSDVSAVFDKGAPAALVAILVLKTEQEWQRFMRFMARYAEANDLSFSSAGHANSPGGGSAG